MQKRGYREIWQYSGSVAGSETHVRWRTVLPITPPVRHLIRTKSPVSEIVPAAMEDGMHTMKQDGIEKVLQGFTVLEQVRAVCA